MNGKNIKISKKKRSPQMSKKKEKIKVKSLGKFFGATEFPN